MRTCILLLLTLTLSACGGRNPPGAHGREWMLPEDGSQDPVGLDGQGADEEPDGSVADTDALVEEAPEADASASGDGDSVEPDGSVADPDSGSVEPGADAAIEPDPLAMATPGKTCSRCNADAAYACAHGYVCFQTVGTDEESHLCFQDANSSAPIQSCPEGTVEAVTGGFNWICVPNNTPLLQDADPRFIWVNPGPDVLPAVCADWVPMYPDSGF